MTYSYTLIIWNNIAIMSNTFYRDHQLYLKLGTSEFHRPSIHFLGYIITADGIQMDQGKIETIHVWPYPHAIIFSFIFANFY